MTSKKKRRLLHIYFNPYTSLTANKDRYYKLIVFTDKTKNEKEIMQIRTNININTNP